jgi:hypothetical protein
VFALRENEQLPVFPTEETFHRLSGYARSMRSHFALRGMTDCVFTWLAQSSEVLFDARQDATCAGL